MHRNNCAPPAGCKPIESKCVLYSGTYLTNLEVFSGVNLDVILGKIDAKLGDTINQVFVQGSTSLFLSGNGSILNPVTGSVNISLQGGNALSIVSDGLFVPTSTIPDLQSVTDVGNITTNSISIGQATPVIDQLTLLHQVGGASTIFSASNNNIRGLLRFSDTLTEFQAQIGDLEIIAPLGRAYLSGTDVHLHATGSMLFSTIDPSVIPEFTTELKILPATQPDHAVILSQLSGFGTVSSVGLTSTDITVGGSSPITSSGTFTLTLPSINPNVGVFNNLTVNAKGQVTAGANVAYLTTETDPTAIKNQTTLQSGANFNISGNGTISGITTTPNINGPAGTDLNISTVVGQRIALNAGAENLININEDGVAMGNLIPNSARSSVLEVAGNVWSEDAYILGVAGASSPRAEFGLAGTNDAFVRMMNTGNLDLMTSESNLVARVNGTTENFEIFNQVKISGGTPGIGKVLVDADGSGLAEWQTIGGGSGTVTSVGLSAPSIFSVTGSPVTTSGVINLALATAPVNQVFAGPVIAPAAAPTFRFLVGGDIPVLPASKITSGVFDAARLGSGTANATTALFGDQTYKTVVTSIGLTSSDITVGGTSPITTSGTFTLTLPNINANVGTFNNVTVNAKGQVTAASNVSYLTTTPTLQQTSAAGNTTDRVIQFTGNNVTPSSGAGVEIAYNGTVGRIRSYNRTGGAATILSLQDTGGDVSIGGTTTGGDRLYVFGTATATQFKSTGGLNGATFSGDVNGALLSSIGPSPIKFAIDNVEEIRIDPDGKLLVGTPTSTSAALLQVNGDGTFTGSVTATGGGFNSARSLKTDIKEFSESALEILSKIPVRQFKYVNGSNNTIGFIADEVPQEVLIDGQEAMDIYSTIGILIKGIQELNDKMDGLV